MTRVGHGLPIVLSFSMKQSHNRKDKEWIRHKFKSTPPPVLWFYANYPIFPCFFINIMKLISISWVVMMTG
jgi:hypothetical protein